MASSPQQTTNTVYGKLYSYGSWGKGSSSTATKLKQFPKTNDILPDSETLWKDFAGGVLRGDTDGYDGNSLPFSVDSSGEVHAFNRTFSNNSPPDLLDVTWTSGGDPASPFAPSLTSPAAGGNIDAGFDYTQMPQGPDLYAISIINPAIADGGWGAGPGCTAADRSPNNASNTQINAGGTNENPAYQMGVWG